MEDNDFNIFRDHDCDSDTSEPSHREPSIYVFGYGSLIWRPDFDSSHCITGYIRGYSRKFFQGNVTHRGTDDSVSSKISTKKVFKTVACFTR